MITHANILAVSRRLACACKAALVVVYTDAARGKCYLIPVLPVDFFVRRSNLESKPDGQLLRPFRNNAIGGSMTENPPQFDKMTE